MADWVTISALATAGGTLVLATATFASVKSANRAARTAERALMAGIRPLLVPSRLEDPPQKVHFADGKWVAAPGGGGVAEVGDGVIYLALSVRNVGTGIAILHGWRFFPERRLDRDHAPIEEFQRLTRDIYVPAGDDGFWQGAFRDSSAPEFGPAEEAISRRDPLTIQVLYGDHEGGQRVITQFLLIPREDGSWLTATGRHWNVDRPDPR